MVATSTAGVADFYEASGGHVQQLRQAMAYYYIKSQIRELQQAPYGDTCMLTITFDESEQAATILDEAGIYSMVIIHAHIRIINLSGAEKCYNISLPPAFVNNADSETYLNVVLTRIPVPLQWLVRQCRLLWVYIGTDSARACLKVGRHFAGVSSVDKRFEADGAWKPAGMLSLHGRCLMHMLAVCVGTLVKNIGVLNPMFCGCCLLQKGGTRRMIRKAAHRRIDQIEIVFGVPAPPENEMYLRPS